MDFQFAMWQIIYLFISPQKVFRGFVYRKRNFLPNSFYLFHFFYFFHLYPETKNQFARDDPAFLVLLSSVLIGKQLLALNFYLLNLLYTIRIK